VPEGDTIHRVADRLRPALEGALLRRFDAPRAPRPHPRAGERITEVGAQGKHLLVHFERGLVLDTHMGMTGRWDLYPAGQRWRQPAHLARVVIDVDGWTAVCFSAPTVWVSTRPRLDHLGPDLCDENPDIDECLRRLRALDPATELADALLDQQVCAGVGNVYKSEVCFACRVHPLTPVGAIDDDQARALITMAARLLRANLGDGRRSTVGGIPGALAVYGRVRQPCRRCGTPILSKRTGPHKRTTYWCARCQPLQDAPDG
jgi:endonuclease-8